MLKEKLVFVTNCLLAPTKKFKLSKYLKLKTIQFKSVLKKTPPRKVRFGKRFLALKTFSLVTSFAIFLFLAPTFAVNAVFSERVLPEPVKALKISDEIISERAVSFSAPLKGRYISTYFSFRHPGIDIPDPVGTPIKAISEGEVTFAGYSLAGYGNMVIIQHKDGYSSFYAHLSRIGVQKGQSISEGQIIGAVGSTGNSTGNHLHIEVHVGNQAVNPLNYFSPF